MYFNDAFLIYYKTMNHFVSFIFTPFDSIFGTISWFEIMFGTGLVVYCGYQFAKWLIDIIA